MLDDEKLNQNNTPSLSSIDSPFNTNTAGMMSINRMRDFGSFSARKLWGLNMSSSIPTQEEYRQTGMANYVMKAVKYIMESEDMEGKIRRAIQVRANVPEQFKKPAPLSRTVRWTDDDSDDTAEKNWQKFKAEGMSSQNYSMSSQEYSMSSQNDDPYSGY